MTQGTPSSPAKSYVSDFPGSAEIPDTVFKRPGYNEPKQSIPNSFITLMILGIASLFWPPLSSIIALAVFPLSLVFFLRQRDKGIPGIGCLRAAIGISGISLANAAIYALPLAFFGSAPWFS